MLEIVQADNYTETWERTQKDDAYPCVVCGRATPNPRYMVHMFWGTHVVTEEEAEAIIKEEGGGGDMYFYPIGTTCLRKHPEYKPYAVKQSQPGSM